MSRINPLKNVNFNLNNKLLLFVHLLKIQSLKRNRSSSEKIKFKTIDLEDLLNASEGLDLWAQLLKFSNFLIENVFHTIYSDYFLLPTPTKSSPPFPRKQTGKRNKVKKKTTEKERAQKHIHRETYIYIKHTNKNAQTIYQPLHGKLHVQEQLIHT